MIKASDLKGKFIRFLSKQANREHPEGSFWADQKKRNLIILLIVFVVILGISQLFPSTYVPRDRSKSELQLAIDDVSGTGIKTTTVFTETGADKLDSINNQELIKAMQTEMQNRETELSQRETELFEQQQEIESDMDAMQLKNKEDLREIQRKHQEELRATKEAALKEASENMTSTIQSENKSLINTGNVSGSHIPNAVLSDSGQSTLPAPTRTQNNLTAGIRVISGTDSFRLGNGEIRNTSTTGGESTGNDVYSKLEQAKAKLIAKESMEYSNIRNEKIAKAEAEKQKANLVPLTAGTILSGTLINGLYVPIGSNANNDPMPAIFRIKREALMPNFNSSREVVECIIVASSKAAVESIRVEFRASTLTCINNNGVTTEDSIKAMSTGFDGSTGVEATLISRNSEMLAKTAMAGFLQGLTDILSQTSLEVNSDDGVYAVSGRDLGKVTGSAAIGGAGTALERLSDYYMDLADMMLPTLHVKPGTQVDFIVTSLSVIDFNEVQAK